MSEVLHPAGSKHRASSSRCTAFTTLTLFLLGVRGITAQSVALTQHVPVAAPAPPPVVLREGGHGGGGEEILGSPGTLYSIGQPTDEEQEYLELINRARANPNAEATRLRTTTDPEVLSTYAYFNVDLNLMASQFAALSAAPPLSLNANLSVAARLHGQDMLANNFQGHYGSDGADPGTRMTRQGYTWSTYGENVYASAESVFYGHAGFEVDWGNGPGGMQTPAGHRSNIHSAGFREAGIGVINGVNGGVGPQLVTQDFANKFGSVPFVTGVAYYDLNQNGRYDAGEGIGGVSVAVTGSTYSALTASSGGYSVPVPGNGSYTVTFSSPDLTATQRVVTVTGNNNVKVDYVPAYVSPTVAGPSVAVVGQSTTYNSSAVGGATAYQWKRHRRLPLTATEGAEGSPTNVTLATTGSYTVLATDVKAAGARSFHLAHVNPSRQTVTWNKVIRPATSSQLSFSSRLGWASSSQVGRAQVSTNGGSTWLDVWSAPGTSSAGQTAFARVTNSLAPFAGQEISIRFSFDFTGGSYYNSASAGVGWYIDEIGVSQAEELVDAVISDMPARQFAFTAPTSGNYGLRVRAQVGGRWLDWGPTLQVTAVPGAPGVRIRGVPRMVGNQVEFDVDLLNGLAGNLQVERSASPQGPWSVDLAASVQTVIPGSRMRALATKVGPGGYYRVVVR